MEDNRILLGRVGEWIWYKYYFDKANDCFVEEKYHEEYLDTGTVFEGSNIVTAQYIYRVFAENRNADGITNLLKYANETELTQNSEDQRADQELENKLFPPFAVSSIDCYQRKQVIADFLKPIKISTDYQVGIFLFTNKMMLQIRRANQLVFVVICIFESGVL